jgi:hypothetical protein
VPPTPSGIAAFCRLWGGGNIGTSLRAVRAAAADFNLVGISARAFLDGFWWFVLSMAKIWRRALRAFLLPKISPSDIIFAELWERAEKYADFAISNERECVFL